MFGRVMEVSPTPGSGRSSQGLVVLESCSSGREECVCQTSCTILSNLPRARFRVARQRTAVSTVDGLLMTRDLLDVVIPCCCRVSVPVSNDARGPLDTFGGCYPAHSGSTARAPKRPEISPGLGSQEEKS